MEKLVIGLIKMLAPLAFKSYLNAFPGGDQIKSLAALRNKIVNVLTMAGDPEEFCRKMKVGLDFYYEARMSLRTYQGGRYAYLERYLGAADKINNGIDKIYGKLRLAIDTGVINNENWTKFKEETIQTIDDTLVEKSDHRYLEAGRYSR